MLIAGGGGGGSLQGGAKPAPQCLEVTGPPEGSTAATTLLTPTTPPVQP